MVCASSPWLRSGRITSQYSARPATAPAAAPAGIDSATGNPRAATTAANAPTMASSPCAKFTMPVMRWTMTNPAPMTP
jgi:hypothetical protein